MSCQLAQLQRPRTLIESVQLQYIISNIHIYIYNYIHTCDIYIYILASNAWLHLCVFVALCNYLILFEAQNSFAFFVAITYTFHPRQDTSTLTSSTTSTTTSTATRSSTATSTVTTSTATSTVTTSTATSTVTSTSGVAAEGGLNLATLRRLDLADIFFRYLRY